MEDVFEPERRDEMLATFWEQTTLGDMEAWFSEPWRDGRNAARLCLTAMPSARKAVAPEESTASAWLYEVMAKEHHQLTSDDYVQANEFKYEVSRTDATRYGVLLDAALAIYANWVARSDGGGLVPNVHLSSAFGRILYSGELDEREAHEAVGLWRARDAGMSWTTIGGGSDEGRLAATHRWLWMNRRYAMAYTFARSR